MEAESSSVLWIVIVGFLIAFILAFGIGANDVANSFGTSVGAKVLTLRQACIVAGIFELAGAVLLGSKVSDTVRKGIIDINMFAGNERSAMVGAMSALLGTSIWLIVATFFKLPVSGTHSVIGATIGYALVASGPDGVNWGKFGLIAASWVISPVLSGIISSVLFVLIRKFILSKSNPFKHGLHALPLFYGITIAIILLSIFYDSPEILGINHMPAYAVVIISLGSGILVALLIQFAVAPWLKKRILAQEEVDIHRASVAAEDDRNLPELQLPDETPVQNGDIGTGIARLENGTLEIPRFSDLLRRNLESDEITTTSSLSSLPSIDYEDTITSEPDKMAGNMLQLPRNKFIKNVIDADTITVCSELSTDSEEKADASRKENASETNIEMEANDRKGGGTRFSITKTDDVIGNNDGEQRAADLNFEIEEREPPCIQIEMPIDDQLTHHHHHVSVPTTPTVGRRTDSINLIDGAARMSKEEEREKKLKEKTEKDQARMLARSLVTDEPKTGRLFQFLQIMTASFGAFAHGGNDVSNAIGPVISIWVIYDTGMIHSKAATPIWILLYGGAGIVIGLFFWGRRVIETIGESLTPVTPTSGFSIEIGAAMTVLLASNLSIPVSTTHCKVGSVVFTGRIRSRDVVDWSLFVNIVVSWVVTMPVTGLISAGVYAAIMEAL